MLGSLVLIFISVWVVAGRIVLPLRKLDRAMSKGFQWSPGYKN